MSYSKVLAIVHGTCHDGVGAGYCIYKKLNQTHDLEMLFVSPSNQDQMLSYLKDYVQLYPNAQVRFFDLGLRGVILESIDSLGCNYLAFDHHSGSHKDITSYYQSVGKDVPHQYTFDNNRSGVRLAWDHLFPEEEIPKFLAYLEDGDLWRFSLEDAQAIITGLHSMLPLNFSTELNHPELLYKEWDNLQNDPNFINRAKEIGSYLLKDQEKQMNTLKSKAAIVNVNGLKVYMVNTSSFDIVSKMGNMLAKLKDENNQYLADYAMLWYYDAKNKNYCASLRSRNANDQGVDVSQIAKEFDPNGGGHYSASGFKTNNIWKTLGINSSSTEENS
jgi:hypothetical protein